MKLKKNYCLNALSIAVFIGLSSYSYAQTSLGDNSTSLTKGSIGSNDSVPTINCTTVVNSTAELENTVSTNLSAGTTICLSDGNYSNLNLNFGGDGTAANPVTVAAQTSGAVTIDGNIKVNMSGDYAVLQGFTFRDGNVDEGLIQTRSANKVSCNNCRVTENTIIDMKAVSPKTKWIQIYGTNNRIDHNWFSGKTAQGPLMVVERVLGDDPDRSLIDHNYFGDRPPALGRAYALSSDNEYEAIRVGDSKSHTTNSFAVVEHNYFEHFDGEAEVVSNKAGSVTISHNTLRDNRGSIVTRHGENAIIDNNFVFGDGHPFASGIRIVDANQIITNNYISGARNPSSKFYGGILIHNSDLSTTNGYQFVENILIANNTVVDSNNSINLSGGILNEDAQNVFLINNLVDNAIDAVIKNSDTVLENSVIAGNIVFGARFSDNSNVTSINGISFVDPALVTDNQGIFRPNIDNVTLIADTSINTGNFDLPTLDMDGQTRTQQTFIGADEVLSEVPTSTGIRGVLNPSLVGPLNYVPPVTEFKVPRIPLNNPEFNTGDLTGWVGLGASVVTNPNDVFSMDNSVKLDSNDASLSQSIILQENTNYTFSAFTKGEGKIQVTIGGVVTSADFKESKYRFASVSFNTASNASVLLEIITNGSDNEAFVDSARLVSHANIVAE